MARPTKTGLDYFPLDTQLDDKVFGVECVHGNDGFAVIVKTWQAMYQTESGELNCSDVIRRTTLAKRANITEQQWLSIIDTAVSVGLFDKKAWEDDKIITSRGVQKRISKVFSERESARQRRKKQQLSHNDEERDVDSSELFGEQHPNKAGNRKGKGKGNNIPATFHSSRFRDEAYWFADWFAKELKPESLTVTSKVRDDWALVWYHLRETDDRGSDSDKETLMKAIEWARNDDFWSKNFLSPLKLRKKGDDGVMYIDRFIELSRASQNALTGARGGRSPMQPVGMTYELAKPLSMEA